MASLIKPSISKLFFIFPSLSNSTFISAIKYPLSTVFSNINNSAEFSKDLINDIKFFISKDFVEISKFWIENWLLIMDFKEIWVFIFSIPITLFCFFILDPTVFTFNFSENGSKTNLIFFNSTSIFLSIFLILM